MVRSWKNKFILKETHVIKISRNVIYLEYTLHVSTTLRSFGILVYHVRNVDVCRYVKKRQNHLLTQIMRMNMNDDLSNIFE